MHMTATVFLKRRLPFFGLLLALAIKLSHPAALAAEPPGNEDLEICKKNLRTINEAIKAYRADHKDLPSWLSDLLPNYIKNPNVFVCPMVKKTGAVNNHGIEDPNITTSYTYEFSDTLIPDSIYPNSNRTMEDWKRRQMSVVGSKIPMVRCHLHARALNLSFDGQIYESETGWEAEYGNVVDPAELSAARLLARERAEAINSRAQTAIPPRDPQTPANLVDLSRYYNAALTESWHQNNPGDPPANDLSWLPRGLQKLGGVLFDVRGLIQISSPKLNHPRFTTGIRNVRVDQKARALHFLHGTGWSASDGTTIAEVTVRLANGEKHQFNILYGDHVYDWVASDVQPKDSSRSQIVWQGRSPATGNSTLLHVYKTQWVNPTPEQTITTIDYVGANNDPAPFLIAITAE